MVTLVYRCETDERDVTLNEEHDEYEWCSAETARERFGVESTRWETILERAIALEDEPPFEAVTDPYADSEFETEELLDQLTRQRRGDQLEE